VTIYSLPAWLSVTLVLFAIMVVPVTIGICEGCRQVRRRRRNPVTLDPPWPGNGTAELLYCAILEAALDARDETGATRQQVLLALEAVAKEIESS